MDEQMMRVMYDMQDTAMMHIREEIAKPATGFRNPFNPEWIWQRRHRDF
jgi:hypothetical protein